MELQCDVIIDDYYQWMVGHKHLRADGLGQQWKFYLIREPVTEEKIQQAEVEQLPKVGQVLEPVSPVTTMDASDGEESEGKGPGISRFARSFIRIETSQFIELHIT